MTTIVGVRKGDQIVIGSDSLLMQGEIRLTHDYVKAPKIYRVGNNCLGFSGSTSHYLPLVNVLTNMGDDCKLNSYEDVFKTFTKVHKKLKDEFYLNAKKTNDDPYEFSHFSLMVVNSSGIYTVYGHRDVMQFQTFWVNGSGRPYALGAMYTVYEEEQYTALDIAQKGLSASMEFDRGSGGEMRLFTFKAGEDAPPEVLIVKR